MKIPFVRPLSDDVRKDRIRKIQTYPLTINPGFRLRTVKLPKFLNDKMYIIEYM